MPQFLQNLQRYANDPLEFVNGVVRVGRKIGNELEYGRKQINSFIEDVVPEPIVNTLDNLTDALSTGYEASPVGALDEGAAIASEGVSQITGAPALGMAAGFVLGMVDGSPGINVSRGGARFNFIRPKGKGYRGDPTGRVVESMLAEGVPVDKLPNPRAIKQARGTNYNISDQELYHKRYAKAPDILGEAHHVHDHDWAGTVFNTPDGEIVKNMVNKAGYRTSNDAYSMADFGGVFAVKDPLGKTLLDAAGNKLKSDHQGYLHDYIYKQLPTRIEIQNYIDNGSWERFSPKMRANRIIKSAAETEQAVLKFANWKLNKILETVPELKNKTGKEIRQFLTDNPTIFRRTGIEERPSFDELMALPKQYNNERIKNVFGIEFGRKPKKLDSGALAEHPMPAEFRRRPDGKIAGY